MLAGNGPQLLTMLLTGENGRQHIMTESEVIQEVRRRYRICNRLFTVGGLIWIPALGAYELTGRKLWLVIMFIGYGIFFFAFALTLAIYRCPVCNKYLSRFRPDKTKCPGCGARVRETPGKP